MNFKLLTTFLILLLGSTSNSLKCKFASIDITEAESPEEQLMINKTTETTEYECPIEDKNCINLKGFLIKEDPNTGEQKNMTFALKSCESDLTRFMEPIEQRIEQTLNYSCGASSNNENQTVGPLTYSIECCSIDECNVSDNNNNTIVDSLFPGEDITEIIQKDEDKDKENDKENEENKENENKDENPILFENGENKENNNNNETINNIPPENNIEDLTTTNPFLLDSSSTQLLLENEQNNNNTNTTTENPKNGATNTFFNTITIFTIMSTIILVGFIW